MEIDLWTLTKRHYGTLVRSINPTAYFINKLSVENVINDASVDKIMDAPSADDKTVLLLRFVMDSASIADCVQAFLATLRECGQEHVANIFDKKSEKIPMSEEHYQILFSNLGQVERVMDPDCGIVDELVRCGVFTAYDRQRINAVRPTNAKSAAIVETILRKSDCSFQKFMDALEKIGQDHVIYVLANNLQMPDDHVPRGTPPIRPEFIESMRKTRSQIVDNMDLRDSGLLDLMVECKILFDYDRVDPRSVGEQRTSSDMNVEVMRLIPRISQSAFDKFIIALIAKGQSHIAALFIGDEIHGKIIITYRDHVDITTQQIVEIELKLKLCDLIRDGIRLDNALSRSLVANNVTVSYIKDGCIAIGFRCLTSDSLQKLRHLYTTNEINRLLMEVYYPLFADSGAASLNLEISDEEFARCETYFEQNQLMTPIHRQALLQAAKSPTILQMVRVNDDLLSRVPLCERSKKAVKSSTGIKQPAELFEIISRQPDWAFGKLVDALLQTNQNSVVDFLIDTFKIQSSDSLPRQMTSSDDQLLAASVTRDPGSQQSQSKNKDLVHLTIDLYHNGRSVYNFSGKCPARMPLIDFVRPQIIRKMSTQLLLQTRETPIVIRLRRVPSAERELTWTTHAKYFRGQHVALEKYVLSEFSRTQSDQQRPLKNAILPERFVVSELADICVYFVDADDIIADDTSSSHSSRSSSIESPVDEDGQQSQRSRSAESTARRPREVLRSRRSRDSGKCSP